MQTDTATIEVWDPLLRSFHWLLVAAFALAWWSQGRDIQIHLLAGSMIPGLLLFRFIWGVIGEQQARFSSFLPARKAVLRHLGELLHLQASRHTGHTPIGGVMIYSLLITLLILGLSGMLLMGMQMGIGLFSGWGAQTGLDTELLVENVHSWSFDMLECLIIIHLAGIMVESVLQKTNLTAAMITGRKKTK
ncbi:MAG: cytochrome b/b6 domain-containing protein [Mariprofundaceae bacterium]|nr:cytochrome b/b6 domain-containing protein [Mariprofundaceae bacterium]